MHIFKKKFKSVASKKKKNRKPSRFKHHAYISVRFKSNPSITPPTPPPKNKLKKKCCLKFVLVFCETYEISQVYRGSRLFEK